MFDISFTELLIIGIVALVVIGPEKLPKVARTVGHLVGRAQRYVNDVKRDIKQEMDGVDSLKSLKQEVEDAARSVKDSVDTTTRALRNPLEEAQEAMRKAEASVNNTVAELSASVSSTQATDAKQTDQPESPASADTPAVTQQPSADTLAVEADTATTVPTQSDASPQPETTSSEAKP